MRLEVCLPPEGLRYELHPDGCHLAGGSFQPGQFLDVSWQGQRRFWAVLRPAADGQQLPPAEDLPGNLGLRIGGPGGDLLLVRPIKEKELDFEGIRSDAGTLLVRGGGRELYLADCATRASLAGGQIGFEATEPVMITASGLRGSVFVDRPHKQPTPMAPVKLAVRDPRLAAGATVRLDGRPAGKCSAGGFEIVLEDPGMHRWEVSK